MARAAKNGVKFISLDCNFFEKEKTFLIEERFGEIGVLRALQLMTYLYQSEGFFMEWGEGSAYYFAKKIIGKSDAADMVESLVDFLIEIGFFDAIEDGEKTYLSSKEIVEEWLNIIARARQKVNLERIPQSVILAYATQFIKNKYFIKTTHINTDFINAHLSALNAKKSTFIPSQTTFIPSQTAFIPQRREEKSTNKQTNNNDFAIMQTGGTETRAESDLPPLAAWGDLAGDTVPPQALQDARTAVLRICYFRGISSGLVDAAALCVASGWLNVRGLRNIRRKAEDELDLFRNTNGRRGVANGWETVRDCIGLVIREHGYTPPDYSRLDPEPPPPKQTTAERSERQTAPA